MLAGLEMGLNPEETEVLTDMEKWTRVRVRMAQEEISRRELCRQEEISYKTLQKILTYPSPPGYPKRPDRPRPKIGTHLDRIFQILLDDRSVPQKQRHTAKRIFERLRDEEGYTGGYTQVKVAVRQIKQRRQEVFVPLVHRPGDAAQVDFFEVTVEVAGERRKAWKFVMRLMHSGRDFAWLYERCDQLSFLDGHVRAFGYFGGVPQRCIYDNLSPAVARVTFPRRRLADRFKSLVSHYVLEPCFARVGVGHDKGGVEGRGGTGDAPRVAPAPHCPNPRDGTWLRCRARRPAAPDHDHAVAFPDQAAVLEVLRLRCRGRWRRVLRGFGCDRRG